MIFVFLFIGLVVAILVVAAFMASRYNVEKVAIINKPVAEVMNKIGDLNYYASWNPWQQMDPLATKTITGAPKTPGHRYEWHGKKVGTGSLTVKSVDDTHISFDLEFLKPWKSHAQDKWSFEKARDNETRVTWHNSGDLPWPMARLMGPIINKNLNHQFEKGLINLKTMIEKS
ncbi:MAG TPA: SRPBCC family protein [Chitinophagaceae bacterium]|nr:SRPBCC family protein [Chitinophagaceae bacterium]